MQGLKFTGITHRRNSCPLEYLNKMSRKHNSYQKQSSPNPCGGNSCTKNDILIICLMLFTTLGQAQSFGHSNGIRSLAVGAYSKHFADIFSVTSNQAALGNLKAKGAGIFAEKRFLLEELNLYTITACLPVQFGGIGIAAKYFGSNAYKATALSIGFGKNLGKISVGIQFNYNALHLTGYGKAAFITVEGGAILQLTEQLYAGLHVYNPTGTRFGENNLEKHAAVYSAGFGFEASEKVFLSTEILKEADQPVNINVGLHYVFAKKFFSRLGLATETGTLYFGAGWKWNDVRIETITSYHHQLGFTPGLMLLFQRHKEKE